MPADLGTLYEVIIGLALDELEDIKYEHEPLELIPTCNDTCVHTESCLKKGKRPTIYIDPDFVIYGNHGKVQKIMYITHWRSKTYSHLKFWRTIEELFEHKIYLPNVTSINTIFEVDKKCKTCNSSIPFGSFCKNCGDLNPSQVYYVTFGWKKNLLYAMDWVFDNSLYISDPELKRYVEEISRGLPKGDYNAIKGRLKTNLPKNSMLKKRIKILAQQLKGILDKAIYKKQLSELWSLERDFCSTRITAEQDFLDVSEIKSTRWRHGIFRFLLVMVTLEKYFDFDKAIVIVESLCRSRSIKTAINFLKKKGIMLDNKDLLSILNELATYVTRRKKGRAIRLIKLYPYTVLNKNNVIDVEFSLDHDLQLFLEDFFYNSKHIALVKKIYDYYANLEHYRFVYEDLRKENRIYSKLDFLLNTIDSTKDEKILAKRLLDALNTCDSDPTRQIGIRDNVNWVLETLIVLGNVPVYKVAEYLSTQFYNRYNVRLEEVAPKNSAWWLIHHLINRSVSYRNIHLILGSESELTQQLFVWLAHYYAPILLKNRKSFDLKFMFERLKERKIHRVIEGPELNPLVDIFNSSFQNNKYEVTKLRGRTLFTKFLMSEVSKRCINTAVIDFQLSVKVKTADFLVPIKVQASVGRMNVNHKRKELAGRIRAVRYTYVPKGDSFKITRHQDPIPAYGLLIDGDWIGTSEDPSMDLRNLYEAGFDFIYPVRNLEKLITKTKSVLT